MFQLCLTSESKSGIYILAIKNRAKKIADTQQKASLEKDIDFAELKIVEE